MRKKKQQEMNNVMDEKQRNGNAEERLQELYGQLADLIPEELAEDFVGMGYAKGRCYDASAARILIVEKAPRPGQKTECVCEHSHGEHSHGQHGQGEHTHGYHTLQSHDKEDEKDFTGVVARISKQLLGKADWQESIAWTYLYKLAPKSGKPDQFLYNKQKELCEEIIKAELEALKPTHVLFLTGWGSVWNFDLPLSSLLKGEAVEGWGRTESGTKLIVTRYAVRKPDDKFAMDILEKIKCLEELDKEK